MIITDQINVMSKKLFVSFLFFVACLPVIVFAQHTAHHDTTTINRNIISGIDPQPLLAQAIRLREALNYLGSTLSPEDEKRLLALQQQPLTSKTATDVQS